MEKIIITAHAVYPRTNHSVMALIQAANSLLSSLPQQKKTIIFANAKEARIFHTVMELIPKSTSEMIIFQIIYMLIFIRLSLASHI